MESDEELIARLVRGDLEAFDRLYERYAPRLFPFLVVRLGDRGEAEDVFHETFLKTLRTGSARFEAEGAFRAWLFRVGRNLALNRVRSRASGERAMLRAAASDAAHERAADASLEERERLAALDGAVARLPEPLAEVYHLRASGLSYEEMSHVLGIPLGTVKSQMFRLVAQLKEELEPWTVR